MKTDWPFVTPGIPDAAFIRGKVPMTKEEVRCVTLSKLRLQANHCVVDVGAGTGSIAIEAARLCPQGKVYALERQAEALALIAQNAERFGVLLRILPGDALAQIVSIPSFDRVIIGGSGGTLPDLLSECAKRLSPNGRVVINAITLETAVHAIAHLKKWQFTELDVVSISVARGRLLGESTLMEALNPVYVISASAPDLSTTQASSAANTANTTKNLLKESP